MRKLNNKGMTTVEVIVCFILVVTIATSMYSTVASFNQKRIIEQNKEEIYTYKNLLTKEVQDDFIKIGITSASYGRQVSQGGARIEHTLNCAMRDGTKRRLVIIQQFTKSQYHTSGSESVDDYYMIKYGPPTDMIDYPIPELGTTELPSGKKAKDFSINNVWISISDDNVLNIYIGFYHPELTTRYGVQIIAPINYITSSRDTGDRFHLY
ncbi:MAG: hypothetical protein IJI58_04265 [Bacilli bacterium]|nr:hypothetical protein [Bacilli bacterium]